MDKRHQDNLTTRLEEASLMGCAHICWQELYRWYGVQKLAARTYRDLEDRWQALTDGATGNLMMVEGRGGIFLFGAENAKPVTPADSNT